MYFHGCLERQSILSHFFSISSGTLYLMEEAPSLNLALTVACMEIKFFISCPHHIKFSRPGLKAITDTLGVGKLAF